MKNESMKYATYWRNNLIDVALQGGGFEPEDTISMTMPEWESGQLENENARNVFRKMNHHSRRDKDDQVEPIDILAYARVYTRQKQHTWGKRDGIPGNLSTVMLRCQIARNGKLSATSIPYIPRSLLEPIEYNKFAIGSMTDVDKYLTEKSWSQNHGWQETLAWCEDLEKSVCDMEFLTMHGFVLTQKIHILIIDAKAHGAHAPLISLYDNLIRDAATETPLFDQYATGTPTSNREIPEPNATICVRAGHMEPSYPLAGAQRDALSVVLSAGEGEIVAVNGPPGTGKTTMLQSVVASLWTTAALEDKLPPVIVAASTNNQAVTNVIDSFGKVADIEGDVYSGRWLPEITSYGCYYPAESRIKESRENGYQIEEMWEKLETQEYFDKASKSYLSAASKALGINCNSVNDTLQELLLRMRTTYKTLSEATSVWQNLQNDRNTLFSLLGNSPQQRLDAMKTAYDKAGAESGIYRGLVKGINKFVAEEPWYVGFMSGFRAVSKKRFAQVVTKLDLDMDEWNAYLQGESTFENLENAIKEKTDAAKSHETQCKKAYENGMNVVNRFRSSAGEWQNIAEGMGLDSNAGMSDFDVMADTAIRHTLFKMATHYWEGRWLTELNKVLKEGESSKKGKPALEARWRRRAMLTPCAVSTMFRLPAIFSGRLKAGDKWKDVPLYNYIDLLIVDEAGQVSSAIGGVAFALANRALVVGDTKQLQPVVSGHKSTDAGNFREVATLAAYCEAENSGRAVCEGSVMKIAQTACHYHYDEDLERGMMLYEHRRCVDDIINFCNDLCYKGKLLPKRGNDQHGRHGLPRMGYLHIPGESETVGKSRRNPEEAEAVVEFVREYAAILEQSYHGKKLEDLIAIVTPFARQSDLIEKGLEEAGYNGITVGTVNRMQGAEYRVVLFSPVYTRHDSSRFMLDAGPNMLNVAVSRAQDSFIVIGDMDGFDDAGTKPSAVLARHLMRDGNAIATWIRKDGGRPNQKEVVEFITTQAQHDAFLSEALSNAKREIIIVSPWISGAIIDFTGLADHVANATGRDVRVRVYTDLRSNMDGAEIRESARLARQHLTKVGAEVRFVNRIHNKDVFVDDAILCRGSFNWLSVFRRCGEDQQLDSSIRYAGIKVSREKDCILGIMEKRAVNFTE